MPFPEAVAVPTAGIAMCQNMQPFDESRMSEFGYKRRCASPFGYARTTPGSRHSQPNVRSIGFSSAAPPGADAQGGGADSPNLTHKRHSVLRGILLRSLSIVVNLNVHAQERSTQLKCSGMAHLEWCESRHQCPLAVRQRQARSQDIGPIRQPRRHGPGLVGLGVCAGPGVRLGE